MKKELFGNKKTKKGKKSSELIEIKIKEFIAYLKNEGEIERFAAMDFLNLSNFQFRDLINTVTYLEPIYEYEDNGKTIYGIAKGKI